MIQAGPDLFDCACHYADDAFRNVTSLRVSRNLFTRVSGDGQDVAAAIAAEMATRSRSVQPLLQRPFEPWYGFIGFPFDRRRWGESRYPDGTSGVWYGSTALETTVHETVHHFRRDLANRGWDRHDPPIVHERRVARAVVDALVFDLRAKVPAYPALVDPLEYGLTHAVGRDVHKGHHPGLLAPSARMKDGVKVDIFDSVYLSNPRDVCCLTYRRLPTGEVEIEREPGQSYMCL